MNEAGLIPDHQLGFRHCHGTPEQYHIIDQSILDSFEKKVFRGGYARCQESLR